MPESFHFYIITCILRASLIAQLVKNPPAMRETWVQSLGWEDPLEKGMAITPVFWPGEFHGLSAKSQAPLRDLYFHHSKLLIKHGRQTTP